MTYRARTAAAAVTAVLLATALGGCSDGDGGSSSASSSPPSSAAPSATASSPRAGQSRITVKDFTFTPGKLTVRPGAKVTVVNEDSTAHTVTATGAKQFDTGTIGPGKTATFTAPAEAGDYPYLCTIHPNMKGSLTVG